MAKIRDKKLIKAIALTSKKIRKDLGITQSEVSFETGLHIARIEAEEREATISSIHKLCKFYGVSLSQFFKEVEKHYKP